MGKMPAEAEEPEVERTPRRTFVFLGALAAASLLPRAAKAQGRTRSRSRRPEPTAPAPKLDVGGAIIPNETPAAFAEWDTLNGLSRLVRRVTMGMTPNDVAQAKAMGWNGYLTYQLNYSRINDAALENGVAMRYPLTAMSSDQLFDQDSGTVANQLRESTIYRAAFSQRQALSAHGRVLD